MTEFDDREKAFEKKFGLDEELTYKVSTKAARLLSAWAAEQLDLSPPAAESYACLAIDLILASAGPSRLMDKIETDLKEKGIKITRHSLEREMNGFTAEAWAQIESKG